MTLAIFDSSSVEPARQFDLFYETIVSKVIRLTPERPEGIREFPARVLSHCASGRSCHIIEAPSHETRRTLGDIKSSDPEQIHLNYMMSGERRLRLRECEVAAGPGHVFAVNTWRPFELLGTDGGYSGLKLVFPAADAPASRSGQRSTCPEALRAHRLYNLLCVTCGELGSGLGQARDFEITMLMSVAECLYGLMTSRDSPEAVDDWRLEMFSIVNLEIERNLGDPEYNLDRLTCSLGVSRRYVQRVMERQGTTFSTLLREKRMAFARSRLANHTCKVEEIAARSGYTELSAFYRAFKRQFGYAPGTVRHPGSDVRVAS
jgi:AraC-like DNA-binding protein